MKLRKVLPLEDAAEKYGIGSEALIQQIDKGAIQAVLLGNDTILVAEEDVAVYAALQATDDWLVSMSEAASLLGISTRYVANWVKYGWLPAREGGKRRAKQVPFKRAQALALLRAIRGPHRGSRLIPRGREPRDP